MRQPAAAPIFGTEALAVPVCLALDRSGAITGGSEGLQRLFGRPAPEWIGRPLTALLAGTAADSSRSRLEEFFSASEGQIQFETAEIGESGWQAPVRFTVWRTGADGQPAFVCLIEFRKAETERDALRELVRTLLGEREQERREMAARVHRELAQKIAAGKLDLFLLRGQLATAGQGVEQQFGRIEQSLAEAGEAVQRVCNALYPSELDYLGLGPAVRALAVEASQTSEIAVRVEWNDDSPTLAPERAILLYRIIQKALENVLRRADVNSVTVAEKLVSNRLQVQIRSDGSAVAHAPEAEPAAGWTRVRELAALIQANFEITVENGVRTTVRVDVHVGEEYEAHCTDSG